jgi:O-antigen ligase
VAAEQGVLGLAVYVALLVAAFGRLFAGAGRSPARIALAACFAALVLHTMTYADFLEDPVTWTLLGIGSALVLAGREQEVSAGPTAAARAARRDLRSDPPGLAPPPASPPSPATPAA